MISASAACGSARSPTRTRSSAPDDEPRVARELVAHGLRGGHQPARGVGERAGAGVVDDERAQLLVRRLQARRRIVAGEARLRRGDARRGGQQHAQRGHARLARRRLEVVAAVQHDTQQAGHSLRALGVAAEPPQVLRDARRDERAGPEAGRRRTALQPEPCRALRLGREDPGVLAHRSRLGGDAPATRVRRDTGQPARHHDVRRAARDGERTQHAAPQLDAVAGERRCALRRGGGLPHPVGGPRLDASPRRVELRRGRLPAEHRAVPADRRRGPQHELGEVLEHVRPGVRVPAPPARHGGKAQRAAEQVARDALLERGERRVLQHPGAERVDDRHRPRPRGLHEAGDPELGLRVELERVAVRVVDAAQDDVDRLALPERAHPHAPAADRQVGPLDERVPERRREHRVLEGGLVVRAGAEDDDARIVDVGRRGGLQRGAQRAEERREAVHARVAVERREHPLAHEPVLHRVARPRRGLRAVGEHDEPAVLAAPEVRRVVEELVLAGQADAVAGVQEARVPEHDLGRDEAAAQQLARAVEVREDEVEQLRALDDAGLDLGPLAGPEDDRHGVQAPPPAPAARRGGVAIDDAVLVEQSRRLALAATELLDAEPCERLADVLRRRHARRRSRVRGCSPGPCGGGISTRPGVWPCASKRLARRASASPALTGRVS